MRSPIAAVSMLLLSSVGAADKCKYGLEIMYLQDISDSYENHITDVKKYLPEAIKQLVKRKPDVRFGFGTFMDKPLPGLGESAGPRRDYCLKIHQTFSDSIDETYSAIQSLVSSGGQDWREAQVEAMYRATVSNKVGWTRHDFEKKNVRMVIVATNSWSHQETHKASEAVLEWNKEHPNDPWPTFPVMEKIGDNFSPVFEDENAKCDGWSYPVPRKVGLYMKALKMVPVFFVSPAVYHGSCSEKKHKNDCAYETMRLEAERRKDPRWLDPKLGMQLYYEEVVANMTVGFTTLLKDDLSDLVAQFDKLVDFAESTACK